MTDHRIGETVHGVEGFLQAGEMLESLISVLHAQHEAQALDEVTRQFTLEKSR